MDKFLNSLLAGSNNPPEGSIVFDSSDHIRFQNGQNVSGHNYGCNRRLVIEKNIQGDKGYTVSMYNLDGIHPLWQNNVQMTPNELHPKSFVFNFWGSVQKRHLLFGKGFRNNWESDLLISFGSQL